MKLINGALLDELSAQAKTVARKRINYNFHKDLQDSVQRLLNAIEPGTYIRPHRHAKSFECFLMVRGTAVLLVFDDDGRVCEREMLSAEGPVFGVEIPDNVWHTIASLEPGTAFFEIKQGPYVRPQLPHVASWSPAEEDAEKNRIVQWFSKAQPGDFFPASLAGEEEKTGN